MSKGVAVLYPLAMVKLTKLMERTRGRPEVTVGLIDGPVALAHPNLANAPIREIPGRTSAECIHTDSTACAHGTLVAGILSGERGLAAPAICPGCTLLVRPIFEESEVNSGPTPRAAPEELAAALIETVDSGARVINVSASLMYQSGKGERELQEALDYAVRRRVLVVAASGNQGVVGATCLTRHPWVISVAACDRNGRLMAYANIGRSISRNGLTSPGEEIVSLGSGRTPVTFSGTSAAAPFVTGTIALLLSEYPNSTAAAVKLVLGGTPSPRRGVLPPLLDAWAAYTALAQISGK